MTSAEPAPPVLDISGAQCTASYLSDVSRFTLTNVGMTMTSLSFTEPQSVSGLVYTFGGDGCTISLGDLSYIADSPRLDGRSLPRLICEILRNAGGENALTLDKVNDDGTAVFSGELNGMHYSLYTDSTEGTVRRIAAKSAGLDMTLN